MAEPIRSQTQQSALRGSSFQQRAFEQRQEIQSKKRESFSRQLAVENTRFGGESSRIKSLLNNPDYIVTRRADGTIASIKQKEREYVARRRGSRRDTKKYSPHVLTFDSQGNLIKEVRYDTYRTNDKKVDGERRYNNTIFVDEEITYNPNTQEKFIKDFDDYRKNDEDRAVYLKREEKVSYQGFSLGGSKYRLDEQYRRARNVTRAEAQSQSPIQAPPQKVDIEVGKIYAQDGKYITKTEEGKLYESTNLSFIQSKTPKAKEPKLIAPQKSFLELGGAYEEVASFQGTPTYTPATKEPLFVQLGRGQVVVQQQRETVGVQSLESGDILLGPGKVQSVTRRDTLTKIDILQSKQTQAVELPSEKKKQPISATDTFGKSIEKQALKLEERELGLQRQVIAARERAGWQGLEIKPTDTKTTKFFKTIGAFGEASTLGLFTGTTFGNIILTINKASLQKQVNIGGTDYQKSVYGTSSQFSTQTGAVFEQLSPVIIENNAIAFNPVGTANLLSAGVTVALTTPRGSVGRTVRTSGQPSEILISGESKVSGSKLSARTIIDESVLPRQRTTRIAFEDPVIGARRTVVPTEIVINETGLITKYQRPSPDVIVVTRAEKGAQFAGRYVLERVTSKETLPSVANQLFDFKVKSSLKVKNPFSDNGLTLQFEPTLRSTARRTEQFLPSRISQQLKTTERFQIDQVVNRNVYRGNIERQSYAGQISQAGESVSQRFTAFQIGKTVGLIPEEVAIIEQRLSIQRGFKPQKAELTSRNIVNKDLIEPSFTRRGPIYQEFGYAERFAGTLFKETPPKQSSPFIRVVESKKGQFTFTGRRSIYDEVSVARLEPSSQGLQLARIQDFIGKSSFELKTTPYKPSILVRTSLYTSAGRNALKTQTISSQRQRVTLQETLREAPKSRMQEISLLRPKQEQIPAQKSQIKELQRLQYSPTSVFEQSLRPQEPPTKAPVNIPSFKQTSQPLPVPFFIPPTEETKPTPKQKSSKKRLEYGLTPSLAVLGLNLGKINKGILPKTSRVSRISGLGVRFG